MQHRPFRIKDKTPQNADQSCKMQLANVYIIYATL